jgi:hypothetical protein
VINNLFQNPVVSKGSFEREKKKFMKDKIQEKKDQALRRKRNLHLKATETKQRLLKEKMKQLEEMFLQNCDVDAAGVLRDEIKDLEDVLTTMKKQKPFLDNTTRADIEDMSADHFNYKCMANMISISCHKLGVQSTVAQLIPLTGVQMKNCLPPTKSFNFSLAKDYIHAIVIMVLTRKKGVSAENGSNLKGVLMDEDKSNVGETN